MLHQLAVVVGIAGACRKSEWTVLHVKDVEEQLYFRVSIKRRAKMARSAGTGSGATSRRGNKYGSIRTYRTALSGSRLFARRFAYRQKLYVCYLNGGVTWMNKIL